MLCGSGVRLQELPALPTSLQELNAGQNSIASLRGDFGTLVNLQLCNLSGNDLKRLPFSVSRLKALLELDLRDNMLTELTPGTPSLGC